CDLSDGLLFFVLFVPPSVLLAIALAYVLSRTRRPVLFFVLIGLAIAALPPLYDLGLHPQFYVYNHVFGGVLGPVYDTQLSVRPGLFVFRGLTLLWAGCLVSFGLWRRKQTPRHRASGWSLLAAIGIVYVASGWFGWFNTPERVIQQTLGSRYQTEHFDIYYDAESISPFRIERIGLDHEFRYAQLQEKLDVTPEGRILTFLYPDEETKGNLTGARRTNVAPVWLSRPQTHILLAAYGAVFPHELAHVFSRPFGIPGIRASVSVGLVEGFAVAVEPPDGRPTPDAQVAAAARLGQEAGLQDAGTDALASDLAGRLSPWGFWLGRGAVSYTTAGSFVGYLLEAYGAEAFKEAYAWGRFEPAYGKPLSELAGEWAAEIGRMTVTPEAAELVSRRFTLPSLFEQTCPHDVPPAVEAYTDATFALAAGDTTAARAGFESACALAPDWPASAEASARLDLADGRPRAARDHLLPVALEDTVSVGAPLVLAHAQSILGAPLAADSLYALAQRRLPLYARSTRALIDGFRTAPPTLLSVYLASADAETRARRVAQVDSSGVLPALAFTEAEQFKAAIAALAGYSETPAILEWRARLHLGAGHYTEAAADAERAVETFLKRGDVDGAAHALDFVEKIKWESEVAGN
ncbi:MAG: hypothetical protein AAGI08_16000, partial [Bacteroidota bacterium]